MTEETDVDGCDGFHEPGQCPRQEPMQEITGSVSVRLPPLGRPRPEDGRDG